MPCHARPYYTIWYDTIRYYTTPHYTTPVHHTSTVECTSTFTYFLGMPYTPKWSFGIGFQVTSNHLWTMPFQTQEVTNWFCVPSRELILIYPTLGLGKRKIIFKTAGGEMLVSWEGNSFAWTLRRVRTAHSQWFDQGFGWRQLPSLSLPLIKMNSEDRPTRWECRRSGKKGLWNDQLCDFVKQKHQKNKKRQNHTSLFLHFNHVHHCEQKNNCAMLYDFEIFRAFHSFASHVLNFPRICISK